MIDQAKTEAAIRASAAAVNAMSSDQIRSLPISALRMIVNGMTGADHICRSIAQGEIARRRA